MNKNKRYADKKSAAEEEPDEYVEKNNDKTKKYIIRLGIIFCLFVGFLYLGLFLFVPRLTLNGDKVVTIGYKEKYVEAGARASYIGKDISDEIKITGEVVDGKVGEYKVNYSVSRNIFNTKKVRRVNIVDTKAPIITLAGEKIINICPNKKLEDFEYTAVDDYDGDITDKVVVEENDDRVIYRVKDSSGNETEEIKVVNKKDLEKPVITLEGYPTMYLSVNTNYNEPGFKITDNCEDDLEDRVEIINNVDNKKVGKYNVIYRVKDSAGNEETVERIVYVINETNVTPTGPGIPGVIYLTFDDGPSSSITPKVLDVLRSRNVKATFFVINTGSGLDYLIKRAYDEGHTIALHSYTHKYDVIYKSVDAYYQDLQLISDKVESITGEKSKIIRFPGGGSNTVSRKYSPGIMTTLTKDIVDKGYRYYDWNVSSGDAGGAKTKDDVYRNVISGLSKRRSNVVLMHDYANNYKTLEALDDIISYGINNNFTFEAMDIETEMIRHKINN